MTFTIEKKIALPEYSSWRSLYPVRRDGALIAFIGYPTGWGKGWRLCALIPAVGKLNFEGYQPAEGWERNKRIRAMSVGAIEDAFESPSVQRVFKTAFEIEEAKKAEIERRASLEANRRETERRNQAERIRRLDGLKGIARNVELALTNSERDALETTIDLLDGEVTFYQKRLDRA